MGTVVDATETMIERTEERFVLKPDHVAGDTAYGTGAMLGALIARDITPHIPVRDKSKRVDGTLSRDDFGFDHQRDVYVCPGGKTLATTGRAHDGKTLLYRASTRDCAPCRLKQACCPNTAALRIPRDVNQDARGHTRSLMGTEAYLRSGRGRKKIERLFGDVKRNLGLTRLRLRGLAGVHDEFLLAAAVQNLKRLARLAAIPPPQPMIA